MSIAAVTRELLVRYLDIWAPSALHGAHAATYLHASVDGGQETAELAEAALRVFGEFADRLARRQLNFLVTAPEVAAIRGRLQGSTPPGLFVHVSDAPVAVVLKAVAAGGPVFALLDRVDPRVVSGRQVEVLTVDVPVAQLQGFDLKAGVTLVHDQHERTLGFGTKSARSLEAFKDEMWALDDFAGVRYRDPNDPEGHLMDITLEPNPGALRREVLAFLGTGSRTVTELKRFALTETVYRGVDAVKVVTALLHSGAVTREPQSGRLGGDVVITIAG